MAGPDNAPETVAWNWRSYFSSTVLTNAESDYRSNALTDLTVAPDGSSAQGEIRGFHPQIFHAPTSYAELLEYRPWSSLTNIDRRNYCTCTCISHRNYGTICRHIAALMVTWEHQHGPFIFTVDPEVKKAYERKKLEERREHLRRSGGLTRAHQYFDYLKDPLPGYINFQLDNLIRNADLPASSAEINDAEKMSTVYAKWFQMNYSTGTDGVQRLTATWQNDIRKVSILLTQNKIVSIQCNCGQMHLEPYRTGSWYYYSLAPAHICSHALALWMWLRERVLERNPGDKTDQQASRLLQMLSGTVQKDLREVPPEDDELLTEVVKQPVVDLTPRIVKEDSRLKIYFDLSVNGVRPLLIKDINEFIEAVDSEKEYTLGKTVSPDFSRMTFTEKTEKWYKMLSERARVISLLNETQSSVMYRPMSIGNSLPLEGTDLDTLYDLAEGGSILYQNGYRNDARYIRVTKSASKANITINPLNIQNRLVGIVIEGSIPSIFQGKEYQYIIDSQTFSRVSNEDFRFIKSFQEVADTSGNFKCILGERNFQEFMYRVLPALRESGQVNVTDNVGALLDNILPPEPEFTFFVDLVNKQMTCRATVQYGDAAPANLGFAAESRDVPRDAVQENRVIETIQIYFPQKDLENKQYYQLADDDSLIRFKTEGLTVLSRFGIVNGSDAFRRIQLRPAPHTGLKISLESDLLDLSIQTTDLTEDELLEMLASYRKKKRWYRLRSGDYVDLAHARELYDLDQTLNAMDLTIEDLLKGGAHIPKYRALYVDKLLEAHDELAASRDREFKSLIRSFQTIKDSDFEAPASLQNTLRPYQMFGFRWLSTVAAYGFGGILADEMGLGKTLQMLTWLLSQKDAGEQRPALVVCPASLVYNWHDECRRFTPALSSRTIDGNIDHRKELISGIETGEDCADLYITSYDLLRRDIALYDKTCFSAVILDEAQFIKNQKAAVSKSVRVLKASHRFALTGTPIENRLSELWSIFDFLMPGFLYSASEFAMQFETPIMKFKDPDVTARLARMTEPFILRRKKMDVLKDLPEKLEETRSAAMEEDQRKLYDAQVVHMRMLLDSTTDSNEDKMRILAEITRLRQICCDPSLIFENYHGSSTKRIACMELIESAIDGGHRMLVFSQFTSMLALLAKDLNERNIPFFTITGSTPKQERLRLVNTFNTGDVPVFLISLKAGGTGLNLTGADVVIHYDPWWNVAVQNQATDRAHRIGQTRQVTVIKLIAAETIEDRILQLQEAKRDLAEAIISGESNSLMSLSKEELMDLIG